MPDRSLARADACRVHPAFAQHPCASGSATSTKETTCLFARATLIIALTCWLSPAMTRAACGNGQLAAEPQWTVCFTPPDNCTERIVTVLNEAETSVLVQAYSFTSAPIAQALVDAHKRGVAVEVLLDKSQRRDQYTVADFLAHAGVPTRIDAEHAKAHNKIMIVDGRLVITGSFNFTKAAEESNAENLLLVTDKALAQKYADNWRTHADHSELYVGKAGAP
ncbi:phospholipase D family nuclease [Nitrospira sp. Kam-Ns4a]